MANEQWTISNGQSLISNPQSSLALGRRLPGERWLNRIALGIVVLIAAVLRFANLDALGYANHYYTAAVVSMLQSWHNFFFVAAEPGGSVSIDKPPVGLWLQTISASIFGVNSLGVLLPQLLAGVLSVILLYHLVQRKFGKVAGLLAGLALAITPVVIATDRNNTMDSTLILTLLLAAWMFIKATETTKLRYLLLGGILVGIGFNIKMLEAFLPLPAFYALYLFGSSEQVWKRIGKLALVSVVLLAVSLSWAVAVDLIPADQRPYVGSSGDNSVISLMLGYNGAQRLLGMGGRGGLLSSIFSGNGGGGFQPQQGGFGQPPGGGGGFQGGFGGRGGGGGFFNTGNPGLLRLFVAPLSIQMSWLLPFGIVSALLLAFGSRLKNPLSDGHQALVLWGGWLLIGGAFFSVAGFFHEYYLSMLAPPLAALVGIGVIQFWKMRDTHRWLAIGLLLGTAVVTLVFQFATASAYVNLVWWVPFMFGLFLIGATLLIASGTRPMKNAAIAGFICIMAALMVTPGVWSALTNLNASTNQSLPSAYTGGQASFGPAGKGGADTPLTGLQVNEPLLAYLEANTQNNKYLMAVPSSMQGADYVIATGRPVLYLGGFSGQDQVETAESMQALVGNGDLRYVYLGGGGGPGGGRSNVSSWVTQNGTLVQGFDATTSNQGAPDGTVQGTFDGGNQGQSFGRGFGGSMQVSLYDLTPDASTVQP